MTSSPYRSVSEVALPTRSTGSHGRTDGRTNEDRPSFAYKSLLCVTREKSRFSTLFEMADASRRNDMSTTSAGTPAPAGLTRKAAPMTPSPLSENAGRNDR